jgi:FkbH-like protein
MTSPLKVSRHEVLTPHLLMGSRWMFGRLNQKPAATNFQFLPDGRIAGYQHYNEQRWLLDGQDLKIFNGQGEQTWLFKLVAGGASIALEGEYQNDPNYRHKHILVSINEPHDEEGVVTSASRATKAKKPSDIRLVIWDLDETFWAGTLSEGGIDPIPVNAHIIEALVSRGIMNSVCSKNDYEGARTKLIELGVWDRLIFPKIAFTSKGAMVKDIIAHSQLRPASVLFIDDNESNLAEASHFSPGLNLARPSDLSTLLDDPRLAGKPDPSRSRLANYKILEAKTADLIGGEEGKITFLWKSEIKVSFHYDVIEQFDRIHDLVNRTNQLNFTKSRWPENPDEAREAYRRELAANFHSQSGYIRVSDKYGNYGICGFYLLNHDAARHLLFSCRCLHMGIEQFVWRWLQRPKIPSLGENLQALQLPSDWVKLAKEAGGENDESIKQADRTICVRGACDLELTAHYLHGYGRLSFEFPFPFEGWDMYQPSCLPAQGEDAETADNKALLEKLPGVSAKRFESDLLRGQADCYILSFTQDATTQYYQSRSTGLIVPLSLGHFTTRDLTTVDYEELAEKNMMQAATAEQWAFLRSDLAFLGPVEATPYANHLFRVFTMVRGKAVAVVMLNHKVGQNAWLLGRFEMINRAVREQVEQFRATGSDTIHLIEVDDLIRTEEDLADDRGGPHYAREVYRKIADRVAAVL